MSQVECMLFILLSIITIVILLLTLWYEQFFMNNAYL